MPVIEEVPELQVGKLRRNMLSQKTTITMPSFYSAVIVIKIYFKGQIRLPGQ